MNFRSLVTARGGGRLSLALAVGVFAVASSAFAQPVNDQCPGAIVIPASATVYATPIVDETFATNTGDQGFSCQTTSRGRVWYSFTPDDTNSYRFSTCNSNGSSTDTVVAVLDGANGCPATGTLTEVGCSDDVCSLRSSLTVNLVRGHPYFVLLGMYGSSAITANTTNQLIVEKAAPANDVCTAAPQLSLNAPVMGSSALGTNDHTLDGGSTFFSGYGNSTNAAAGKDVVYAFTAPSAGSYSIRSTNYGISSTYNNNLVLYATNTCSASPALVPDAFIAANRTTSTAEELVCVPMSAGQQVFAYVDETSSLGGAFDIEVTACSPETEPNDSPAAPNPTLSCGQTGSTDGGNPDFYPLGTPPAGSRVYAMIDGYASSSNNYDLRVTNATNTLEYDDSDNDLFWGSSSPNIAGTPVDGTASFLEVTNNSATTSIEPYRLYFAVQPPLVSATMEQEPNDTVVSASAGANNYFYGTLTPLPDGGTADFDYYGFTATAGEEIHIGVDGDPTRNGTPINASLQLLDGKGGILTYADDSNKTVVNSDGGNLSAKFPTSPGESIVYRARYTGLYIVRVTGGQGDDYSLSISRNCTVAGGITPPTSASAISPNVGSTNGGEQVTVTGTGFQPGARVRIGGAFGVTQSVSPTSITALTPPGVPGNATVEVVNLGNQSVTMSPGGYLYISPPTVTSISPTSGSSVGGTNFVITGTDFVGTPISVSIGGAPPATFTVDSPTQISGTTAAHAAGIVSVAVTSPYGTGTKLNAYTFIAPPTITGVTPNHGSTLGNETVTINGANLNPATVKWDGAPITPVGTPSSNAITILTPAHAAGAISVQVINVDGQQDTVNNAFTYIRPPQITTIVPNSAISTGGDTVTINGVNFTAGATVTFDGIPATNVTVAPTGDSITVTVPGHATLGQVDVVVTNPDGQSATKTNGFTYTSPFPAPTITSITPSSGTTYGGTQVVISGTGFRTGLTMTLDGQPQTGFALDTTAQTITFMTPAHVFGAVTIVVTNDDNQTATTTYTYVAPAPTITAINPSSGRTAGGLLITITGDEFLPGATVDLGGAACANPTRPDKNTIQCTTPAHAAGFVTVTVTNPDTKSVAQTNGFEFVPPPVASAIAPTSGTTLGGTTVVITGSSFRGPVTVQFGSTASTTVTVDSATQITAVSPAHAAGVVSVTVTNADGQFSTINNAYTYYAPPAITAINPVAGYAVGGTNVTITGTAFRAGATVKFVVGGVSADATNITVASATSITAKTPAQTPGLADVVVTNVDGQTFTLPNGYRFVPAPTLSAVAPNHGGANGGTRITLTGTNFQTGATVVLGGSPAVGVVLVDAQTLTATTNPHPAGTVDVVVTNPDGQTVTLANAFTFDEAPMVTGVTPDLGPVAGGNTVTIEGSGFLAGIAVKFGTSDATVTNVTATAITVTAPARPAGVVSIGVTNSDGQTATLANAYRYVNPVGLDSITPATGPSTGGTRVTLTGTNITAGSTVTFGGVAAAEVFVLSDTTVQALTPAHDAGAVDVVITTPNSGTATLTGGFTYESTAPTLTDVAPNTGTTEGGTTVSLTGTGFVAGAKVTIGGQQATDVTVVSASLIRAVTPPHAAGQVSVDVANPDGLGATLAAAYTYVAPVDATTGQVADGGTGGVTGESGTDIIKPAPACGCNAASLPALSMMSLLALSFLRRRRK